jgi:hypothetical protein
MSKQKDERDDPEANLPARRVQGQPVKVTPFDPDDSEIPTQAGIGAILTTGAAVRVAKNITEVRRYQSLAAESIARTTGSLKNAQADLIEMQEMIEEAEIRQIERDRRRKQALNASFMDDQNRNIANAASVVQAHQVLKDAEAAAMCQGISNESRLREKRIELLRLTAEEEELKRKLALAQLPPGSPPGPDPVEAKVRYIVKDAVEGLVKTGPEFLYHAYAACHYLSGRMRGVPHDTAVKDTYDLVLDRVRLHPLRLDDAMEYQRRYESIKGAIRSREAEDRSAAAEERRLQAQQNIERTRKEAEQDSLRRAKYFGFVTNERQS